MKVLCPHCGRTLDTAGLVPGSVATCGACTLQFRVPGQPPQPSAPVAPALPPQVQTPGLDNAGWSPNAGGTTYPPNKPLPTPTPAIVSLVLGICSFMMCGIFMSIPGVIVGYRGRRQIDENPVVWGGRGVATAGIIINWVNIVFFVLIFGAAFVVGLLGALGETV